MNYCNFGFFGRHPKKTEIIRCLIEIADEMDEFTGIVLAMQRGNEIHDIREDRPINEFLNHRLITICFDEYSTVIGQLYYLYGDSSRPYPLIILRGDNQNNTYVVRRSLQFTLIGDDTNEWVVLTSNCPVDMVLDRFKEIEVSATHKYEVGEDEAIRFTTGKDVVKLSTALRKASPLGITKLHNNIFVGPVTNQIHY